MQELTKGKRMGEIKLEDSQVSIVLCLQNAPGDTSEKVMRVEADCSGLSGWNGHMQEERWHLSEAQWGPERQDTEASVTISKPVDPALWKA